MKYFWRYLTLLLIFIGNFLPNGKATAATEYYASPEGFGDTCSWDAPCSMQIAVSKATAGEHIYLHSGTYDAEDVGDSEVLYINGNLWMIGGCTWTSMADFNCSVNYPASILDGEQTRRVITIDAGNIEVNLSNITVMNGNATAIDIGECTAWDGTLTSGCGGGIFATEIDSLIISDSIFKGNTASTDATGTKASYGGALYACDLEYLDVYMSEFIDNRAGAAGAGYGGAVYIENSSAVPESYIFNNLFENNNASTGTNSKGAALMANQTDRVEIYNNTFERNNFDYDTDMEGSVVFFNEITAASFAFVYNSVTNNFGKSLLHSYSTSRMYWNEITGNRVWENKCESNIYLEGVYTTHIRNNFFAEDNTSMRSRAVNQNIYLEGTTITSASVDIYYNSIVGADAGINIGPYVNAYVKNNIFAYHLISIPKPDDGSLYEIDSNLFFANTSDPTVGTNPYYGDPKFVNTAEGDLHIRKGSAAIDRLVDGLGYTADIDDLYSRPFGSGGSPYDIGADEWDLVNEYFLPFIVR